MYDELLFADTVTGFAATLVRRDDPGALLRFFLQRVAAVHALMGVAVTVAVDGVLQVPAIASSESAFEKLERRLVAGPCAEALVSGDGVTYADLRRETRRWPEFADAALRTGVLAGACLPLRFDGRLVGVLSLYAGEVRSWTVAEIDAALVLADMASVYLNNATGLSARERRRPTGKHHPAAAHPLLGRCSGSAVAALNVGRTDRGPRSDRMAGFPAGALIGSQLGDGGVHAIDGDGSSLCGRFEADALQRLEQTAWSAVPHAHRCGACQSFTSAFLGDTG